LSTVNVVASIKLEITSENNTLGIENSDKELLLTATQISKTVVEVICPFKYLVKYNSKLSLLIQGA
jgi:hypothetical protein